MNSNFKANCPKFIPVGSHIIFFFVFPNQYTDIIKLNKLERQIKARYKQHNIKIHLMHFQEEIFFPIINAFDPFLALRIRRSLQFIMDLVI